MDFSDTVLLRESTKWWIVGAFLFIGTVFLISRSGSETTPAPDAHASNHADAKAAQEQKVATTVGATQSTASESEKPLVCDGEGCPDCFQKIESGPKSNFASFDPFLTANADDAKTEETAKPNDTTKKTDEAKELDQARSDLKAAIDENVDPLLRAKIERNAIVAKKEKDVFESDDFIGSKDIKPLLKFAEKLPTDSDEWKKISVEEKVARYLKMRVTFDPSKLLIEELVEQLGNALDVEVTVDKLALEEATYDTSTRLSIKSKRPRPLKFVLVEALSNHSLAYIVKNDSLVITSMARQKEEMITRIYPVADLVAALNANDDETAAYDFESLINLIQTTIHPKTWKEVSGDDNGGTVDRHQIGTLLVVRNTNEVLDDLEDLFANLRKNSKPLRKPQPVADVAPDQPDKIVRRVYYITNESQVGAAAMHNHTAPGGFGGGGSMGGTGVGGAVGGGGVFCISAEKPNTPTPPSLNHPSAYVAQFNGGGRPQPSGSIGGMSLAASDLTLSPAQMKARMESLIDIIPATIAPPSWDKEEASLQSFENRIIVVNTAASQSDVEKLLRGLKVLSRVETW